MAGTVPHHLDLGCGVTAVYLTLPGAALPWGVQLRHALHIGRGGAHRLVVPWVPLDGRPVWTLEALNPLTLAEPVECPQCGLTGRVEGGGWRALPPAAGVSA